MKLRNDTYTTYLNKEYRVWNNQGLANLVSNDESDLSSGFTEYDPDGNNNPVLSRITRKSVNDCIFYQRLKQKFMHF